MKSLRCIRALLSLCSAPLLAQAPAPKPKAAPPAAPAVNLVGLVSAFWPR